MLLDHVRQGRRDEPGDHPHAAIVVAPQEIDGGRGIELIPFHAAPVRNLVSLLLDEDAMAQPVG